MLQLIKNVTKINLKICQFYVIFVIYKKLLKTLQFEYINFHL